MKYLIMLLGIILTKLNCSKPEYSPNYYDSLDSCKSWKNSEIFDPNKTYKINYDCLDGTTIPNFSYININGVRSQMHNKEIYTILNFWFIGCKPCIEEIPILVELHNLEKMNVIGIALDSENDLIDFLKEHCELNYEIIPNGKSIIKDTLKMPFAYPTNYLISPENIIINIYGQLTPEITKEVRNEINK